jgi:hypothetical protein
LLPGTGVNAAQGFELTSAWPRCEIDAPETREYNTEVARFFDRHLGS